MNNFEKIGKYGIGFNVVYYVIDCLSFIINGEFFCVFDLYVCYVLNVILEFLGCRFDFFDE